MHLLCSHIIKKKKYCSEGERGAGFLTHKDLQKKSTKLKRCIQKKILSINLKAKRQSQRCSRSTHSKYVKLKIREKLFV